jgi:hypothetical protein
MPVSLLVFALAGLLAGWLVRCGLAVRAAVAITVAEA